MQIQKNINTHVIITFTGGHHFITDNQEKLISKLNEKSKFKINNNTIFHKNIADLVTIQKYYEMFPKKKPLEPVKTFKPPVNYQKKYLNSTQRLKQAITQWKEMEKKINYKNSNGGLARLITWAEEKLNRVDKKSEIKLNIPF